VGSVGEVRESIECDEVGMEEGSVGREGDAGFGGRSTSGREKRRLDGDDEEAGEGSKRKRSRRSSSEPNGKMRSILAVGCHADTLGQLQVQLVEQACLNRLWSRATTIRVSMSRT
jgi:hypothetical protein